MQRSSRELGQAPESGQGAVDRTKRDEEEGYGQGTVKAFEGSGRAEGEGCVEGEDVEEEEAGDEEEATEVVSRDE